jgi:acyl-CoA synthetase (AMP-forming)/AMP-acid ligase II
VTPAISPLPPSPVPPALLDDAETLTDALAALARRHPSFECLAILDRHGREERLSIGTLWARARAVQAGLVARRLEPGDIALVVLPTGAALAAAYFGVMLAGGVPALVATPSNRFADRRLYAERLALLAATVRASIVLGDDEVAAILREHGGAAGAVVLTPADLDGASAAPVAPARPDDIATLQFSSGSTAAPKGVRLTHRAVLNNFRAIRTGLAITTADVSVSWAPLYHDMGLMDAFVLPLLSGCSTALIPTMDFIRDPKLWLWAVHRYRGTLGWAPNFAYALCAKRIPDSDLAGLDLSSWRVAASGAEPVLAPTVEEFAARFAPYGFRAESMTPIYGMAENVTIATAHPLGERPRVETLDRGRLAADDVAVPAAGAGVACVSVGRPLPGCAVEIRDAARRALPERRVGIIWLRSDCLFSGYHRDPTATADALVDGWLNSGDRGYVSDGHLYFIAREKDLIVVGGEKYAPHDIETVLNAVPGVREGCAVVFGVSNAERGTEDLAAVIETKLEGEAELDALRAALRAEVTRHTGLALRYAVLVPPGGVEKTSSGKLARGATQRRYTDRLTG